jgi:hypothetical protein
VFNDLAKDLLEGGLDRDWFFARLSSPNKDQLLDHELGEAVNSLS